MKNFVHNKNGFTLIELLIVVAIFGIIMGAVYSVYTANQRAAYTTDEVVEVQQNLRIAMETVTKDLYAAGFLIDTSETDAISAVTNDTGLKSAQDLGQQAPVPPGSDTITINMASVNNIFARVAVDYPAGTSTLGVFTPVAATQTTPIRLFSNGDSVKIIRFESGKYRALDNGAIYKIKAVAGIDIPNSTMTFDAAVTEEVKTGDRIVRVVNATPPVVTYALVNNATNSNCPANQLCLQRNTDGDIAPFPIVAQNISDFQIRYLLDNNNIVTDPTVLPNKLSMVKDVIVTIWGETQQTRLLSGNIPKIRQLSSVVRLRNRINKSE